MGLDRENFAHWFRMQCEELQLSDETVAEGLGLSRDTIGRIKAGYNDWATMDSGMQRKIQDLLGTYSTHEEPLTPENISLRAGDGVTAYLDDIEEEIKKCNASKEQIIEEGNHPRAPESTNGYAEKPQDGQQTQSGQSGKPDLGRHLFPLQFPD